MSVEATTTNETKPPEKTNTKEDNLVLMRQKYERELAQERARREEIERQLQERSRPAVQDDADDDDNEPYVDRKRLKKEQAKLTQSIKQDTQSEIQKAVHMALQEERKNNWLKQNSDFYEVLQHADKFAERDPELAETILQMPEGFERQKLVYKNIKALGLHKPQSKESTIQQKVDANNRSPYYKPAEMGTAPYAVAGDYSPAGMKNSYNKMKELQARLRL